MATDPEKAKLAAQQAKIYKEIQQLIKDVYDQMISLPQIKKIMTSGEMFHLRENPAVERAINDMLTSVRKQMGSLILDGVEKAWDEGDNQVWKDASAYLVSTEAEQKVINQIRQEATTDIREDAAKSFFNEKRDGLKVSDRIWRSTEGIKSEMEAMIQRAMIEGKSADDLSRELQKLLKDPERIFRRVRNPETGQLELSEAAKNYKPGVGRYRSSYKNARRLAATEISRAYRQSQWESWQNNPLIIGYEIQLSNNHTCSDGKGGIIPGWTDICDELKGRYPKTFRWLGWHPHDRCHMIAIMITKEEWAERVKARAEGKLDEWKPKNPVRDMPEAFNKWVTKNTKRIEAGKHTPYFIQDNFKEGKLKGGFKDGVMSQARVVDPTVELYNKIEAREEQIRKNRSFEDMVVYDEKGNVLIEKRGGQSSVSVTDQELLLIKDSIITHNHPSGWKSSEGSIGRIGQSFSPKDVMMAIQQNAMECRVVTPLIGFSIKRPESGWPVLSEARAEYRRIGTEVTQEYNSRINTGTLTVNQANITLLHEIWKRFSGKFGIEYTKQGLPR